MPGDLTGVLNETGNSVIIHVMFVYELLSDVHPRSGEKGDPPKGGSILESDRRSFYFPPCLITFKTLI